MKKSLCTIGALLALGCLPAGAQESLRKEVEVTKDYIPELESAAKLNFVPVTHDSDTLKPDITYSATPVSYSTSIGVEAFSPVRVVPNLYSRSTPFYLRAGLGYPVQGLLDLYYSSPENDRGSLVAYINHRGRYDRRENALGDKLSALDAASRIGLSASTRAWRGSTLSGGLSFDTRSVNTYGLYAIDTMPLADYGEAGHRDYRTVAGSVGLTNNGAGVAPFGYTLGIGGYRFTDGRLETGESGFRASAGFDVRMGGSRFIVNAAYDAHYHRKAYYHDIDDGVKRLMTSDNNYALTLSPRYLFAAESVDFAMGLDVLGDRVNSYLAPAVELKLHLASGYFTPYLSYGSRMDMNGYRSNALANPYITALVAPNTVTQAFRGGITGSFGNRLSYRLYAGTDHFIDRLFFVNNYVAGSTNEFAAFSAAGDTFLLGMELEGRSPGGFEGSLRGNYMVSRSFGLFKYGVDIPEYDLELRLGYAGGRFGVEAGARLWGGDYFGERYGVPALSIPEEQLSSWSYIFTEQPSKLDISLQATYHIDSVYGLFLRGENLADQKLYRYNRYTPPGIGCSFGVTARF